MQNTEDLNSLNRKKWRTAFAKEVEELENVATQIIEQAKPRGDQKKLWEDMVIVIGRETQTALTLDRLRLILNNWYNTAHSKREEGEL